MQPTDQMMQPDDREISSHLAALFDDLRIAADPNEILQIANEAHKAAVADGSKFFTIKALLAKGQAQLKLGYFDEALSVFFVVETQAREQGNTELELDAMTDIGRAYLNMGNFEAAGPHLQRVLRYSQELNNTSVQASTLNLLAGVRHASGDYNGALEKLQQALLIHKKNQEFLEQAICLNNMGILYTDQSNYPHALESLLEARRLLQKSTDQPRQQGNCLINLGRVYESMYEYGKATSIYTEALLIAQENADLLIEAISSVNLATARKLLGQPEEALPLFQRALEIARQIGLRQVEIAALDGLGTVQRSFGNLSVALEAHREALHLARETGYREQEIESLVNLARVHLDSGDAVVALELLLEALPLAERAELQKFVVDIHCLLADAYQARRDLEPALHYHREYHRLERQVFNAEAERRTKHLKTNFELERARNETEAIRKANELLEEKISERTHELEEARVEIVTRLAVAAEYRDDTTGQHTSRVGTLAALIGERLGLPDHEIELLRLAARLHDVGKIGISDLLMLKPAKLTPEEFERIKEHTVIGAQILSGGRSPLLQLAELVALTHHERWDGRGYPHGLKGEQIPLPGRIVAVADVYDALLSTRPYKRAWSQAEARAEIQRQSGTQFDPQVVAAFFEVVEDY